jgi:hypothetical protein
MQPITRFVQAAGFALLVFLPLTRVSAQTAWNPTADFSITSGNPNGVWTYGWMDTGFTTFTPYTTNLFNGGVGGSPQWYGPLGGDLTPTIWHNTSGSVFFGVLPGQLALHPGPGAQPSVLRWIAPSGVSGSVNVVGQFFAGDGGSMTVGVRFAGVSQWSAIDAGSFDLAFTVQPGDTIDFAVFGSYAFGNTPAALTISYPIPEPAGWTALVGLAALNAGVLCRVRQRRRS